MPNAQKIDVLAIATHPDDAELHCGGTLALSKAQGAATGILDLTRGELGTRGTPETRRMEAEKASETLHLDWRGNVGLPDGGLKNSTEQQDAVIAVIRTLQPSVCLIPCSKDRHPDHEQAHQLIKHSLFYAGLVKRIPETSEYACRPVHILEYMHDYSFEPDLVIDISQEWVKKKESILAYGTQFNSTDSAEPATYISDPSFFEVIEARARYFGHMIGARYGEPFLYHGGPIPLAGLAPLLGYRRAR